jgi:hypothetical protein
MGKTTKLTYEQIVDECRRIHNNRYEYVDIGNYKNTKSIIKIICPVHGEFYQRSGNHKRGQGCHKCHHDKQPETNKKLRYTLEEIRDIGNTVHNGKYSYPEQEYVNRRIPIRIICPKHGEFLQAFEVHKRGGGCKKCNDSRGEKLVVSILSECGLEYIQHYQFPDCLGKKGKMTFDFYIPSIKTIIEYDGEQHFNPIRYIPIEKALPLLEEVKRRDKVKDDYCSYNNIKLLRVSYRMKVDEIKSLILGMFSP